MTSDQCWWYHLLAQIEAPHPKVQAQALFKEVSDVLEVALHAAGQVLAQLFALVRHILRRKGKSGRVLGERGL